MDLGILEKVPPHSTEAEQSVLGSLLLDRDLLPDITGLLKSEDFYLEQHKEIFEAILDLYEQSKPSHPASLNRQNVLHIRGFKIFSKDFLQNGMYQSILIFA
jgi:replicative DNA helicase